MKFLSSLLAPTLALSLALGGYAPSATLAQEEPEVKSEEASVTPAAPGGDDSLNSMWNDEAGKTKVEETKVEQTKTDSRSASQAKPKKEKKSSRKSRSSDSDSSQSAGTQSSGGDNSSAAAATNGSSDSQPIQLDATDRATTQRVLPAGSETTVTDVGGLCTVSAFQASDLVRNSAWPGIGPFNGSDNQYSDPQDNKLSLQIDGDHVTACELLLNGQSSSKQGFLNLQMVCDFMLEALGSKGSKIAEFNAFLERNKEKVAATDGLKLAAGAYTIALTTPGRSNDAVLIQISSKGGAISDSNSLAATIKPKNDEPGEENAITPVDGNQVASAQTQTAPQKGAVTQATTIKKPTTSVKPAVKPASTSATTSNTTISNTTAGSTAAPQSNTTEPAADTNDPLKEELAQAIRTWQTIKKSALKDRDTKSLSKILSGKLLQRQISSIAALVESKHFYELTPKGVTVEKYTEISASPKRYSVFAKVKELTKIMKVGSTAPEKETDDTYNVNYTIEKSGDAWTISDSLLLVKKK